MPKFNVRPIPGADNTSGYTDMRGIRDTNHAREVNLIIDKKDDHFRLKVQSSLFDAFEDDWEDDRLNLGEALGGGAELSSGLA